jgi:Putative bacterial sensory transduction regulator
VTGSDARRLLESITTQWVADPDSDVVWAGDHEGRWGIRMAQRTRDFTTMWFDVGERTIGFEAYLLPEPPHGRAAVYRLCLARNWSAWPAAIAIDRSGDLYVTGRISLSDVDGESIDRAVGAVYEAVELTFRTIVELGFRHEPRKMA